MRKTQVLIPLIIVPLVFNGCCEDEGVCDTVDKADLTFSAINTIINPEGTSSLFNTFADIVNVAGEACETTTAQEHTDRVPIYLVNEENGIETLTELAFALANGPSVGAGDEYEIETLIEVTADGIFEVETEIDIDNDVDERDETNNVTGSPVTVGRIRNANTNSFRFEVSGTGVKPMNIEEYRKHIKTFRVTTRLK